MSTSNFSQLLQFPRHRPRRSRLFCAYEGQPPAVVRTCACLASNQAHCRSRVFAFAVILCACIYFCAHARAGVRVYACLVCMLVWLCVRAAVRV